MIKNFIFVPSNVSWKYLFGWNTICSTFFKYLFMSNMWQLTVAESCREQCSGGSWAYLSISSEHFFQLRIVIGAFLYNWAFLSEHYFPPEHFHLNIIFEVSICYLSNQIWGFFVIRAFLSEHFLPSEHFNLTISLLKNEWE